MLKHVKELNIVEQSIFMVARLTRQCCPDVLSYLKYMRVEGAIAEVMGCACYRTCRPRSFYVIGRSGPARAG